MTVRATLLATLAAVLVAGAAVPVFAAPAERVKTITFDTTTKKGQKMQRQLDKAFGKLAARQAKKGGTGNTAAITQSGTGNSGAVVQRGRNNSGTISQTGNSNAAYLLQLGNNRSTSISQTGDGNGILRIENYPTRRGVR